MSKDYKYIIDKKVLTEFLLTESTITAQQLKELNKVITVVLVKHFSNYLSQKDFVNDLRQTAIIDVLERRHNYDPSYPAYNFIYTICRNQIGNFINRYNKTLYVDEILPISNASVSSEVSAYLPFDIERFHKYLTGEKSFTVIDLTPKDAVNLAVFIMSHIKVRPFQVPDFIIQSPKSTEVLYRLLCHL